MKSDNLLKCCPTEQVQQWQQNSWAPTEPLTFPENISFSCWSSPTCRQTFRHKQLVYFMLYLSDLKTSEHLSLIVAHGDKKVLFPFYGIIYDFPSKQWSGRMSFPLALQHPKRTVILFFTAPSGSIDSTAPRRIYPLLEVLFFWWKCAWEVTQI